MHKNKADFLYIITMKKQNLQKPAKIQKGHYALCDLVFQDIVVHEKAVSDICFFCACGDKPEMMIYVQGMFVVPVAGKPDGREASFTAEIF